MLETLLFLSLALNAGLLWLAFVFARDSFKKSIQIGQLLAEMDRTAEMDRSRAKYFEKSRNIGIGP